MRHRRRLTGDRQDDDRLRFDNNQGVPGSLVFDQVEQVDSTGIYVQDQYKMNTAWVVNAGLRYDDLQYAVTDQFLADGDDLGLGWRIQRRCFLHLVGFQVRQFR